MALTSSGREECGQMHFEKKLAEKSVAVLMDKAQDCFDVAKTQHEIADKQHEIADKQSDNADKLDTIANALVDKAVDLNSELVMDANRTSPRIHLREPPDGVPPKAESLPKTDPK